MSEDTHDNSNFVLIVLLIDHLLFSSFNPYVCLVVFLFLCICLKINERYKSVIIPEHTISNCENDPCCLCGGLIYKSSESTRLYCYANRNDAYIGKKNCYIMGNQLTSLSNTRVCAKCLNNNYTMAKRLQGQVRDCVLMI